MAYAVLSDLLESIDESELIGLTDDDGAGVIDESVVARAIADAESEINGYAGSRHRVPFDPTPPLVRRLAVVIAVYNLDTRRRAGQPERRKRYEDAITYLKGVARGENSLGESDADGTPSPSHKPRIVSAPPIFGRDDMESW